MLNHAQLYYFSPTGGTRVCAETFCRGIARNVSFVDLGKQDAAANPDCELTAFALPVFGGRIPAFAAEKISGLKGTGKKAVTLVVYGTRAYEDALLELNHVIAECGFRIVASAAVVAQHSMVPEVGKGRPDQQDKEDITVFAGKVLEKLESGSNTPMSVPGNHPYKDAMNLPVTPVCLPECSKCGKCASVCPTGAMCMENGVVKTNPDVCILCLACVAACPKNVRAVPAPLQETMNGKLADFVSLRRENEYFL